MAAPGSNKPEVGDILVVIHDFHARSSDELTLTKGDRVELIERDDEFGDGWFLGKHLVNGNSGLFPEVYTRPAPKPHSSSPSLQKPVLSPLAEIVNEQTANATYSYDNFKIGNSADATLPLSSFKPASAPDGPANSFLSSSLPTGGIGRPGASTDSHVLHETLNVIDEHITDLNSPQSNGALRNTGDSGSEYSSHIGNRVSYIQGEETDEEEEGNHSRSEVASWSADQVAEYLFTVGVEKHHCEVFRDQEITGEVILGMDQTSVFIKAFDLGSVGRRLKTWQKIKNLQDEVNGQGPGSRVLSQTYGSEVGSDVQGKMRSRTNTLTGSTITGSTLRYSSNTSQSLSVQTKHSSETPKMGPVQPVSPVSPLMESPNRMFHERRPSAADIRDLHHSRRHSSTDFRLAGASPATPKVSGGTLHGTEVPHKKQPSFDRNWTLGSANNSNHPQSSIGQQDSLAVQEPEIQDSAVDLDRGYFSGTEADPRQRNLLKKRESKVPGLAESPKTSYTEEQRVRSATALSRQSRLGSIDSSREAVGILPTAQKYYGLVRRTASTATMESRLSREGNHPTVTKLEGSPEQNRSSPRSALKRLSQVNHPDFNMAGMLKNGFGGLRAASDAITGTERAKVASPVDTPSKDSSIHSPTRTGSTTPSAGRSFDLDQETAKSLSTVATAASAAKQAANRKKTKKETSAYTRGLQKISPREAVKDADYSGWMKKRSANLMTTWKPRLFVLKGRRLAYFYSEDDQEEKGLIDISFHRVLPADNERLTGFHATLMGASNSPAIPAGSHVQTLADADAERDPTEEGDQMFIFKLVPPRAGLSRAVNFTKPTVHYFAVPNIKQGRLWMAALMKATIDRDDTQPITTTYQQKTISLAKARSMLHRPPALMHLVETSEDNAGDEERGAAKKQNGLGISYNEADSGVAGFEKLGLSHIDEDGLGFGEKDGSVPQSA
ncbi:hypothetical protein B0H65DRAFT_123248 [Neurospora tetraspora]|uniref:Budding protein BOI2 n=1 Tax=Neurospora tetraspora TaxID=94610 RepID=A0AAE0MV67_9PEZI|nr:hypothetical protein B0H65DRAFT_123248 [Neurospora tetraspora]